MKSLLTGSRVYGTPRKDSDIDIVILATPAEFQTFQRFSDDQGLLSEYHGPEEYCSGPRSLNVKSGGINIVVFTDPREYDAWQEATGLLERSAPVTRQTAVDIIKGRVSRATGRPGGV